MQRRIARSYWRLVLVGAVSTGALWLESQLPLGEDLHFLLRLLWVGVALGAVFVTMLGPIGNAMVDDRSEREEAVEIPELNDPDRIWLQTHPEDGDQPDSAGVSEDRS